MFRLVYVEVLFLVIVKVDLIEADLKIDTALRALYCHWLINVTSLEVFYREGCFHLKMYLLQLQRPK